MSDGDMDWGPGGIEEAQRVAARLWLTAPADWRTGKVAAALNAYRYTVTTEKQLQDGVAEALTAKGILFEREWRLTARDRPDFMVARIAVELKIKGSNKDVLAQLMRYAQHDGVDGVVLVSSLRRHGAGLPADLCGKPLAMVNTSRAFG